MKEDKKRQISGCMKGLLLKEPSLSKKFNNSLSQQRGSLGLDFEAQVMASLMIQSNALVSIKTAVQLCSISRQEIDRRVHNGTFPSPMKLSGEKKAIRKAFRLKDIVTWLNDPAGYCMSNLNSINTPKHSN